MSGYEQLPVKTHSSPGLDLGPRIARPRRAVGAFLRIVMVNDVYKLDKYPRVREAVREFREAEQDCMVICVVPGDFLSPCTLTSLDGGVAMLTALNEAAVDFVAFGNHEFDLPPELLQRRISEFKGTWLNSNVSSPSFVGRDQKPLPAYSTLRVGERKVALAGFLLDDMKQFAPLHQPTIEPPHDSLSAVWKKIKEAEGLVDAFVPLTHLNIKQDREFAQFLALDDEIASQTPVILAAHDHEVYIEEAGKSLIFKVGCDAKNIGIIDLWWDAQGKLGRNVHMFDAEEFLEDPKTSAFVQKKLTSLDELMGVPIAHLPSKQNIEWSSKNVRFHEEPLVGWMLSLVKASMPGVELVFLQGGNVRGQCTYEPGPFTYGDLMREFAFDTHMAIVDLPGHVIADSVIGSRAGDGARPFFLHLDSDALTSEGTNDEILEIDNCVFDPQRIYKVATYQFLLSGLGSIEPLLGYVVKHDLCPPLENCLPIKHYVLETCMKAAWQELLSTAEAPESGNPECRVKALFKDIDANGDGLIVASELSAFLEANNKNSSKMLVKFLIDNLDSDEDGKLDIQDIMALIR
eukprot:TRINITY_DN62451_c0_g1_i1.p1 TRINITY_DN62451_c0_g1~~TRINITY_DN62451_c0_g1_i1.p1  ORF type:complete len:599 (+),score=95.32 TRINITY_DN62451_c0_g1_i1:74-1798(+)